MGIQFTGLASGLDTQSIVADLMKVERTKVESIEKDKTRVEWTKSAWSELNTKMYSFYKGDLFSFKSYGSYNQKSITSSNESVVKINDGSKATNGVHTIDINSMAKGSFLTGSKLADDVTSSTTIGELAGISGSVTLNIKTNTSDVFDASNEITVSDTDTISDVLTKINDLGLDLNTSFDNTFKTMFLSSTETGQDVQLSMTGNGDPNANAVLTALGFTLAGDNAVGSTGSDASFDYNGTTFASASNEVTINGLNFDILAETGSSNIVVNTDTEAVYESIKSFINSYNELIVEMGIKLDADSARGYDPLTSDEKSAMTDDEIETWETKIKNSLLKNDTTLSSIRNEMRSILTVSSGLDTSDLSYNFLSELGIVTGNYTEKGMLHIEGDSDDPLYSTSDNKLKEALENDIEGVSEFFANLGQHLYDQMYERMKSTTLSSSLTFYNDKMMDTKMDDYDDDIARLEERLAAVEERYYKQFTAMEQAIQQSNSTGDWLAQQLSAL